MPVDRDLQVLPAGGEDLLVEQLVARVRAEAVGVQVVLGDCRQNAHEHHVGARAVGLVLGGVEAVAHLLLELGEHRPREQPRRDVDLDVELRELGREVGVGDALEHVGVQQRGVAALVGQVELDLQPHRAPLGVEARLREHAREDIEARAHLLAVALPVLAAEDRGGDVFAHCCATYPVRRASVGGPRHDRRLAARRRCRRSARYRATYRSVPDASPRLTLPRQLQREVGGRCRRRTTVLLAPRPLRRAARGRRSELAHRSPTGYQPSLRISPSAQTPGHARVERAHACPARRRRMLDLEALVRLPTQRPGSRGRLRWQNRPAATQNTSEAEHDQRRAGSWMPTHRSIGSGSASRRSAHAELGRAPLGAQPRLELAGQRVDRDALLRERVAVAQGDGAVLERLVVDGDAVGRADLVLAAVALADRAALVVLALQPARA